MAPAEGVFQVNRGAAVVWSLLLGAAAALPPGAGAEEPLYEFRLKNQGTLRGRWLNRDQLPRTTYVIEPVKGGRVVLAREQVEKVVAVPAKLLEYERRREQCPDTVEGHLQLARWCLQNGLRAQRLAHLKRIIQLDPDHREARRGLGYVFDKRQEKWVLHEEMMLRRGFVKVGGRWMLPQEVQLREERRKRELAEKQWIRTVLRWHRMLDSPRRRQEAVRNFRSLKDPHAVRALGELIHPRKERRPWVRLLLVEALAGINSPGARALLAQVALFDPEEEVWLSAVERLAQQPDPQVVKMFIKHLKHPANPVINRAATALGALEDPSAIGPLIESLITVHTYRYRLPVPEYRYSFGRSAAGSSFSGATGSPERVERYVFRNEAVRNALIKLTGVNFDYNLQAWQQWYAAHRRTQVVGNPRRDP